VSGKWLAVGEVFWPGKQREAEAVYMKGHVHGMIMFFCLRDKPGEVYNGKHIRVKKLHAKITERWG
jgi:hypothetical protein